MRKNLENTIACSITPLSFVKSSTGKLAYLVNQYPKVSHSFIRREILALEQRGWSIFRLSIRGWDAELVDPDDIAEVGKTTFVLKGGALLLMTAVMGQLVRSPRRFFRSTCISSTNDAMVGSPFYLASHLSCRSVLDCVAVEAERHNPHACTFRHQFRRGGNARQ